MSSPSPRLNSGLPPPSTPSQDKSISGRNLEHSNSVKLRSLLPQQNYRSESKIVPPSNRDDAPTSGIARPGPTTRSLSSGIPTPRSKTATTVQSASAMPPPHLSLIGRTQSLRKPATTHATQDNKPHIGRSNTTMSSQRTAPAGSKVASKPQMTESAIPSGLSRKPSAKIPGSSASVSQQANSARPLRAQSVSTASSEGSSMIRPSMIGSTHMRSKSTTTTKGIDLEPLARKNTLISGGTKVAPPTSRIRASTTRPAFNTLQQHFSPAKSSSKPPLPPSRLAPSSEEIMTSASTTFETGKMQSELLYLSLLHEAAGPSSHAYESSAQKMLQAAYEALQSKWELSMQIEQAYQETLNLNALAAWIGIGDDNIKGTSQDLANSVQSLSSCVHGLSGLSGPEGRYSRLVQEFTAWIEEADPTLVAGDSEPGINARLFINPLSQEWHESHTSLSQRVRLLEREVEHLPPLPGNTDITGPEPAISVILRILRSSVLAMRQELQVMLDLERRVLAGETRRVEQAIRRLQLVPLEEPQLQPAAWRL